VNAIVVTFLLNPITPFQPDYLDPCVTLYIQIDEFILYPKRNNALSLGISNV
jgi:hypothetical protein